MASIKTKNGANGRKPREKKTVEALSDQQRQALLFQYKRKINPLLAAEKEAKSAVTKAYEAAKAEGIPKKEIQLAIKLETEDGIDAVKSEIERTNRVARWLGIGTQLDFDLRDKQTAAERHYEDGRRAALDDQSAKPPAHLGQEAAQTWLDGHAAGRKTLNVERAAGFKPLGDVVNEMLPPAIGTEAPTHQQI